MQGRRTAHYGDSGTEETQMSGEQIALQWDRGYMMFDVAKLQDAMLVMMDCSEPYPHNLRECAQRLQTELGWTERADYTIYPVAARIALERGILMK
jgi:hypothetical protein